MQRRGRSRAAASVPRRHAGYRDRRCRRLARASRAAQARTASPHGYVRYGVRRGVLDRRGTVARDARVLLPGRRDVVQLVLLAKDRPDVLPRGMVHWPRGIRGRSGRSCRTGSGGAGTAQPNAEAKVLLAGALDLAGFDAAGTGVQALRGAVDHGADPLDVRVPTPRGTPVRVGNLHAEAGFPTANVTYGCHGPAMLPAATTSGNALTERVRTRC